MQKRLDKKNPQGEERNEIGSRESRNYLEILTPGSGS